MRTTIDIPDVMYRRLKARAAAEGQSIKALLLRGAEQVLGAESSPRRVTLPLVRAKGPGSLKVDSAQIYAVISFP